MALDPTAVSAKVGLRISELRRARGWSQSRLADELGATFQWISQVEKGENLTLHTMVRVANALEVGLELLLTEPDPGTRRKGRGRPKKVPVETVDAVAPRGRSKERK